MSCFVVSPETVQMLSAIITDSLNGRQACFGLDIDGAAFKDCLTYNEYDAHKVYRKLYIENLKAWNGRYNDTKREFAKYTPYKHTNWSIPEQAEVYKRGSCYLYQLYEDTTENGIICKSVEKFLNSVAANIAMFYADEAGVPLE